MKPFHFRDGPEPRHTSGEIRLYLNQLALLLALAEFPDGTAPSLARWSQRAVRYKEHFVPVYSDRPLRAAVAQLNQAWVTWNRRGRGIAVTLTPRGRAIVDRTVPARIMWFGTWRGLPPKVDASSAPSTIVERFLFDRSLIPVRRARRGPARRVAGSALDWRPSEYPRDLTEIARLTAPAVDLTLSYLAQRVGRSWLLRIECFPSATRSFVLHRRFTRRPLSLGELAELVDGTLFVGPVHGRPVRMPLRSAFFSRYSQGTAEPARALRELVQVRSTLYPELERIAAGQSGHHLAEWYVRRPAFAGVA